MRRSQAPIREATNSVQGRRVNGHTAVANPIALRHTTTSEVTGRVLKQEVTDAHGLILPTAITAYETAISGPV